MGAKRKKKPKVSWLVWEQKEQPDADNKIIQGFMGLKSVHMDNKSECIQQEISG